MVRARTVRLAMAVAVVALFDAARAAAPLARSVGRFAAVARADARMITQSSNAVNLAKKQGTIDGVKAKLEESALIFTFRADGAPVNKLRQLRNDMPAKSSITLVKNRLMKRAIEGDAKWDHLDPLLEYSNYWAFVHEEDIKASVEAVEKFLKATGRDKKEHKLGELRGVRGGIFGGEVLDGAGVERVSKLPSKIDLIQQIAYGINLVPTKLARGLNQVPTKLARGIKLAKAEPEGDELAGGDEPAAEAAAE
jgi:large subunit ribosomal protein L10